ncbi:AI-2E family transporter [Calidifontibacter terrae]
MLEKLKQLRGRRQEPTRPPRDDEDDMTAPKTKRPPRFVASSAGVAVARTPNEGVDRAMVIGRGLRWSAGWALRTILILVSLTLLLRLLGQFWSALLPIFIALVVSTVLWPPTRWLRNHGFPPALAAATTMLGTIAFVGGVITIMAPTVSSQWPELTKKSIDGVAKVQTWLQGPPLNIKPSQIDNAVAAITEKMQASGDKIASGVFSGVSVASEILLTFVVSLILTFFMIKDGPRFLPWLRSIVGRGAGSHFTELLGRIWQTLSGFIRTQALVSAVDSLCIGIGLVALRVPLAAPLAVITFFGGFIPIVGATIAGALAVLVALVTKGLTTAVIVLIIVIAVQQLEGHILQPFLQSRSMELHPAIVLLGIALGGNLYGIVGAFFAVPAAATIAVTMRYLGEQIDLRTGDLSPDKLEPLTPEGRYAAEQAAKDVHPGVKPDLVDTVADL